MRFFRGSSSERSVDRAAGARAAVRRASEYGEDAALAFDAALEWYHARLGDATAGSTRVRAAATPEVQRRELTQLVTLIESDLRHLHAESEAELASSAAWATRATLAREEGRPDLEAIARHRAAAHHEAALAYEGEAQPLGEQLTALHDAIRRLARADG